MRVDTVLVKVASRCNINCSYCYVYNMGDEGWRQMPKVMVPETVTVLGHSLHQLSMDQEHKFAVVLHGGEPLMLGASRLGYLLRHVRGQLGDEYPISIQTNGMLISDAILDLCAEFSVSLSVSLDGTKPVNDRFRITHAGGSTFSRVLAGINLLRDHPRSPELFAGILAVVDPQSDPGETYGFLKTLGAPSLDFLYRDGNHSRLPFGKASFQSTEYGDWFARLLDVYIADLKPIRIRFLDDMIRLTLGGYGAKEGVGITDFGIAIVDTDGSVSKNDTLKSSFNRADRFDQAWNVRTHRLSEIFAGEEFAAYHRAQRPTSEICGQCPESRICGGGMQLHRWSEGRQFNNPSVYCNDQKTILNHIRLHLRREGLAA